MFTWLYNILFKSCNHQWKTLKILSLKEEYYGSIGIRAIQECVKCGKIRKVDMI